MVAILVAFQDRAVVAIILEFGVSLVLDLDVVPLRAVAEPIGLARIFLDVVSRGPIYVNRVALHHRGRHAMIVLVFFIGPVPAVNSQGKFLRVETAGSAAAIVRVQLHT